MFGYDSENRESTRVSYRDSSTGGYKSFIKPKEFEEYKRQEKINEASREIEKLQDKIKDYYDRIDDKKNLIKREKIKQSGLSSSYTLNGIFSISPIMLPVVLHIIFSSLILYELSNQKSNLGILYNSVYQSVITSLVIGFILLLLIMFVSSQQWNKNVNIGSVIIGSGISIILCSSVIDKVGKTYRITDGRMISPSNYVSSKWMYWNIIIQIFIIIGVIYFHESFGKETDKKED